MQEFGWTADCHPHSPLFYHQGWIALGFSLQIGCTLFWINLAQSSIVFKLTCRQVHYICRINTGVPILTKFWQHNPVVASLLLRSCGPKPPLASDHSRDIEFRRFAHCCRGLPVAIVRGNTPPDALSAPRSPLFLFSRSLKKTRRPCLWPTLLSPSSGHSWLPYGLIRNRKHKALPNQIIISVLLRTIHYS